MDVPDWGFLGGCWLVCQTRARVRLGVDESVSWLKRLCDGQLYNLEPVRLVTYQQITAAFPLATNDVSVYIRGSFQISVSEKLGIGNRLHLEFFDISAKSFVGKNDHCHKAMQTHVSAQHR